MSEITLQKLDQIVERTSVTYAEAKMALEENDGDVINALIFIQENMASKKTSKTESIQEIKNWFMDIIEKGNVSRITIKKDEKIIVDVPVNAGIAATVIAVIIPPILAVGLIAAVATKITIEITKTDGSVEVINKYISDAKDGVKDKATKVAGFFKEKYEDFKGEEDTYFDDDDTMYSATFTQTFDDEDDEDFSNKEDQE